MKSFRFILTAAVAATALTAMAGVRTANLSKARLGNEVRVRFDIVLDDLKLGSDQQLYITPVIQEGDSAAVLPAVLVNGRNMHYGYQRNTAPANPVTPSSSTRYGARTAPPRASPTPPRPSSSPGCSKKTHRLSSTRTAADAASSLPPPPR